MVNDGFPSVFQGGVMLKEGENKRSISEKINPCREF